MTLYWVTNTANSAARLYWETGQAVNAAIASGAKPPELKLPVAFTVFPGEIFQALGDRHPQAPRKMVVAGSGRRQLASGGELPQGGDRGRCCREFPQALQRARNGWPR